MGGEDQVAGETSKGHKKYQPRKAGDCIEIYRNMCAFDWDLKDIQNLRHPPGKYSSFKVRC